MLKKNKEEIRKTYLSCCYLELDLLKPGNVNKISQIKGMSKSKFKRAAYISSKILIQDLNLPNTIYLSVKNCLLELNSNYNLGIILLCAPVIKASLEGQKNIHKFRESLKNKLESIKNDDSHKIFEAIINSNPGGLKNFNKKGNLSNLSEKKLSFGI